MHSSRMRTVHSLTSSRSIGGRHACLGVCMAGVCVWQGGMHGRGVWGGHAWQGACVAGGVLRQGVCVAGHAWQGACVAHTHPRGQNDRHV